jgi:hypothetical protein
MNPEKNMLLQLIDEAHDTIDSLVENFRRRFHHEPKRARKIVMAALSSTGPMKFTFTLNHKGFLSMDITMKKGFATSAIFQGQDATGDVETIQNLTAVSSDTTNIGLAISGNTVTATAIGDTTAAGATITIGAQDADGNALPNLTYSVLISDLATQIVNQSGWSTPAPVAAAAAQ